MFLELYIDMKARALRNRIIFNYNQYFSIMKVQQQTNDHFSEERRLLPFKVEKIRHRKYNWEQCINKVQKIWYGNKKQHEVIKRKIKIPMQLSYYNLKTLAYNHCLNDEVINSYIFLLNQKITGNQKKFKIIDSLLTSSLLNFKKDLSYIEKTLQKKNVTKKNYMIFIMNFAHHWFFVVATRSKIHIYDSMVKPLHQYTYPSMKRLKVLVDWFYDELHQIQVIKGFPQQQNEFQCGVMMILGIMDIIRGTTDWTFNEQKAKAFRPKMVLQLIEEDIANFL